MNEHTDACEYVEVGVPENKDWRKVYLCDPHKGTMAESPASPPQLMPVAQEIENLKARLKVLEDRLVEDTSNEITTDSFGLTGTPTCDVDLVCLECGWVLGDVNQGKTLTDVIVAAKEHFAEEHTK